MSSQIAKQAKDSSGIQVVKLTNKGLRNFYVISAWNSKEEMRQFAREGFHRDGAKKSSQMAAQIRLLYFESDTLPEWKEVFELLDQHSDVRTLRY
ncbi:MAG: hypothetical protein EP338_14195 [Bacteroidetes bacterium]|nr:MAG: hypothetical protein EP338_14195 [Bacteroidota bacterium]